MKQPKTLSGKLKAINKILPIQSIWCAKISVTKGIHQEWGIQYEVPKDMTHANPMFQGNKIITFAYFITLEKCIDNEYKRIVLKKKIRGGSIEDSLCKFPPIKNLQQVGRGFDIKSTAYNIRDINDNSKISNEQISIIEAHRKITTPGKYKKAIEKLRTKKK